MQFGEQKSNIDVLSVQCIRFVVIVVIDLLQVFPFYMCRRNGESQKQVKGKEKSEIGQKSCEPLAF